MQIQLQYCIYEWMLDYKQWLSLDVKIAKRGLQPAVNIILALSVSLYWLSLYLYTGFPGLSAPETYWSHKSRNIHNTTKHKMSQHFLQNINLVLQKKEVNRSKGKSNQFTWSDKKCTHLLSYL